MSSDHKDAPPSPASNGVESKMEKDGSLNDVDEKEASSREPSEVPHDKEVPTESGLAPIQPGPHEAELVLKKLDSTVPEKQDGPQDPFAHLPEHEATILRRQVETLDVKVGYTTLFRYATAFDWLIFVLAICCAVISGAAMPLMTVCCSSGGPYCWRILWF
jgi:ATP-binding cassette, subfamily B (MDR/TAP), member 1